MKIRPQNARQTRAAYGKSRGEGLFGRGRVVKEYFEGMIKFEDHTVLKTEENVC